MEFLKNHYEKVLLSVILLGLAVAMAILPAKMVKPDENGGFFDKSPPPPIDFEKYEHAIDRLDNLQPLDFTGSNNLFNPVVWIRKPDGRLIKIDADNLIGPGAVKIERIEPLRLVLSFDGLVGSTVQMGIIQETNKANLRGKITRYIEVNERKDFFTVLKVNKPDNGPPSIVVELNDTGETVVIEQGKSYETIVGYAADLRYDPENLVFRDRRVGDALRFDKDTNNIVDISSNAVVMSAGSGTRTMIKLNTKP